MSFPRQVRQTASAVWPAVKTSLDIVNANRKAVLADPGSATPAALSRARRPWSRVVLEESLWALGRQGYLCSPEQAAVIQAAQDWVKSWPKDLPPDDNDPEEDRVLYDAVQVLAATVDPDDLDEAAVG